MDVIYREFRLLIEKRKLLLLLLLCAASAYALLIGNLYRGSAVTSMPLAAMDLDHSSESRALIRMAADADGIRFLGTLPDEKEALTLLETKKALAVLVIPKGFSRAMGHGEQVSVALVSDGSNTLSQSYLQSALQPVIAACNAAYQERLSLARGTAGTAVTPVAMSLRIPQNSTQSYGIFYLYGVMITASQLGLMLSFSISLQRDLRNGYMMRRGLAAAFLGKLAVYVPASVFSVLLGLFWMVAVFQMPFRGSVAELIFLDGAFAFAAAGMAGLFAFYFRTELALVQALIFYALPAFLLCGYIWPDLGMVPLFRWLSMVIPLHYIAPDVRLLALTGHDENLFCHSAVLLSMGTMAFILLWLWGEMKKVKRFIDAW